MLTFAMVRTGAKYGPEYVDRLAIAARKFLKPDRIICLTDRADKIRGVERVDVSSLELVGWWAKMALFDPAIRGEGDCVYLDLDTVALGDLSPLARWQAPFGICDNFARTLQNPNYPCRFGSCAMFFADGWGEFVWQKFDADRKRFLAMAHGDQKAIEEIVKKEATIFQDGLPPGFFLNYRNLDSYPFAPPARAKLVIFGGMNKPHTYTIPWLKAAWAGTLALT